MSTVIFVFGIYDKSARNVLCKRQNVSRNEKIERVELYLVQKASNRKGMVL